ncbi:MAG: hypothetical protein H6738_17900 [Alphaproteobacteria bacterium]|nr:hypothetical protein [Alphaproteobacteria bacterium]MCB9698660.1 hypothetical protein [Alphaproteobacteria bacterium]
MNTEQQDLDQLRAALGIADPDRVSEGPGSFVATTRILERGTERLWILRARPGLVRHPFEGLSAAARLVPASVPVARVDRADPPVVWVPMGVRGPLPGIGAGELLQARPDGRATVFATLGRVLAALAATPAIGCSLHAEGGRFLTAPSWRVAVETELARIERALAASFLDLGQLEERLFARAREALASCPEPEEPCLLHGGLSEGHLRFDEHGKLLEVTGWELAGTGDPLCDVGAQLLLDPPDWELVRAELPEGWDHGPAVPARLLLGASLGALRTLVTVAASFPALAPVDRAVWHERLRVTAERALAVDPEARLQGQPFPPGRAPSGDRAWGFHLAAVLGARPAPLGADAIALASVIAILELRDDQHRDLAHQRAAQVLARFDHRMPSRGGGSVSLAAAFAAVDALRPDGRAVALCAVRLARAVEQLLGPAMPSSARASAVEWLALASARFDEPSGPVAELREHALVGWARPEARDAVRPLARAAFAALPAGPTPDRTARFHALAVASLDPSAPLLTRGLMVLGFEDEEIRRALAACVERVDWR